MKGLIIKEPWIDLILKGEKTWEIRGTNTKVRGRIELIKSGSGLIFGSVELVDSKKLSIEMYENSKPYHAIKNADEFPLPYKNIYAWVLRNPIIYDQPIPYQHPRGAVVWVNLIGEKLNVIEGGI